jgi:hypothetical protein
MHTDEIYDLPRLVTQAQQSALQKSRDKYYAEEQKKHKLHAQKLLKKEQKIIKYKSNLRKHLHSQIFNNIKKLTKNLIKVAKQGKTRYVIDYISNRDYFAGWVLTKYEFENFMEIFLVEFDQELATHIPHVALYYSEYHSFYIKSFFEDSFADQRYQIFIEIETNEN